MIIILNRYFINNNYNNTSYSLKISKTQQYKTLLNNTAFINEIKNVYFFTICDYCAIKEAA